MAPKWLTFRLSNTAYCYANSVAMALGALGEAVDPGYVECMTAVAISAEWVQVPAGRLPFLSSPCTTPDRGINHTLEALGYSYLHQYGAADGRTALAQLRDFLAYDPVVVGPLDMGLLLYNPDYPYLTGADHYAVVYAVEDGWVRLHDPGGFPHAVMAEEDFLRAWKAETIAYKLGAYSLWGRFERRRHPTPDELFRATDARIAGQLRLEQERFPAGTTGPAVIRELAGQAGSGLDGGVRIHLARFAFPVSARRCEDFARFYAPYDAERSALKKAQAECLGEAQSRLLSGDGAGLSRTLHRLADLEEQFQALTLARA